MGAFQKKKNVEYLVLPSLRQKKSLIPVNDKLTQVGKRITVRLPAAEWINSIPLSLSLFPSVSVFLQLPRGVPVSVPSRDQLLAFIRCSETERERERESERELEEG